MRILKKILTHLLNIVLFVAIAAFAIMTAAGWEYNIKTGQIAKTSILDVTSIPQADIYLNGEKIKEETPARLRGIKPGHYYLRLERAGYHPWEQEITIQPDLMTIIPYVHLIPQNLAERQKEIPAIPETPDTSALRDKIQKVLPTVTLKQAKIAFEPSLNDFLFYDNNELWLKREKKEARLLARYQQPIDNVVFHPDFFHYFVQLENQVYFCETENPRCWELATAATDSPLIYDKSSDSLIFQQENKYYSLSLGEDKAGFLRNFF